MDANLLDCVISFKKDVTYEVTVSRLVKRPAIAAITMIGPKENTD